MVFTKEKLMKYPLFMIDHDMVDEYFFPNLFRDTKVFFDKIDLKRYYKHYHERKFVDIDGNTYVSVGVTEVSSFLRKVLPLQRKYYFDFELIDSPKLTFEEVKSRYLFYLEGFNLDEAKMKHVDFANKCKTIEELL